MTAMPNLVLPSGGGTFTPILLNAVDVDFPVSDGNGGLDLVTAACNFLFTENNDASVGDTVNMNAAVNIAAYIAQIWSTATRVQTPIPGSITAGNPSGFGSISNVGNA
jgi:hypothetical protein